MTTEQIGNSWWNILWENGKAVFRDGPYTTEATAKGAQRTSEF